MQLQKCFEKRVVIECVHTYFSHQADQPLHAFLKAMLGRAFGLVGAIVTHTWQVKGCLKDSVPGVQAVCSKTTCLVCQAFPTVKLETRFTIFQQSTIVHPLISQPVS